MYIDEDMLDQLSDPVYTDHEGTVDFHGIQLNVFARLEDGIPYDLRVWPNGDLSEQFRKNKPLLDALLAVIPKVTL